MTKRGDRETDDLDARFGPVPDDPDAEPTAAELAQARSFGQLVDKSILGQTPPAMAAEDRDLLDVATAIRAVASHKGVTLAADRQRAIVEGALARAIRLAEPNAAASPASPATTPVIPLASRRKKLPWVVAGASALVAAAAVLVLVIGGRGGSADVPLAWQSRPADALIGPIAHAQAGDAEARIDTIFADRLDGFRDRTLGGRP